MKNAVETVQISSKQFEDVNAVAEEVGATSRLKNISI